MAQQESNSQKDDAQSESLEQNDNPRLLNSEMAKAFQELTHGERTASALESKLDGIHKNLDQLLASFEDSSNSAEAKDPAPDTTKPK